MFIQPRKDALGSCTIQALLFSQGITAGLLTWITLHTSGWLPAASPASLPHCLLWQPGNTCLSCFGDWFISKNYILQQSQATFRRCPHPKLRVQFE